MKAIKRWIRNWLGVTADNAYPHRIVTLINYHDKLIGVDGNGDFYQFDPVYPYDNELSTQLFMKNPLEK